MKVFTMLNTAMRDESLAFGGVFLLVLAASSIQGSPVIVQPYEAVNDRTSSNLAFGRDGAPAVPLRVDYGDRNETFDLDLLGVATGMCSLAGDCDACAYRESNPCQVVDRYGGDLSVCQLPSLLGGAVTSQSLCGAGATVDVALTAPYSIHDSSSNGSSNKSVTVVATLNAFRTRIGELKLTVTAHCGWVLVPYIRGTAARPAGGNTAAPRVVVEGTATYFGSTVNFTAPPRGSSLGGVDRYSCFTSGLELYGMSSNCQVLDLEVELRFAVQRAEVVGGDDGYDEDGDSNGGAGPMCRLGSAVLEATARLKMGAPQARTHGVQAASDASTGIAASDQQDSTAAAVRQKLFSNGVAATMSYTASVDPRDVSATAWLQSLASQFPVVSVAPATETLVFLIGSLRYELQAGLGPAAVGARMSEAPLLPAGLYLESCGRQSIYEVVSAVVSALAAKGVTERYVKDVVCLRSPFAEVAASELPPCAYATSVLFNVTLEIPLGGNSGATTSGLLGGGSSSGLLGSIPSSSSSSSSTGGGSSSGAVGPQALADSLVGAQLAAPWACLSTERQMRMVTRMTVDVKMPNGPGLEPSDSGADKPTGGAAQPGLAPAADAVQVPAASSPTEGGPVPRNAAGGSGGPSQEVTSGNKAFGTAAIVAVALAVALAVVVVVVVGFAIHSIRKSKAAAVQAAAAAAAAATATTTAVAAAAAAAAGGGYGGAAPPGKLSPSPPPLKRGKMTAAEPPALQVEPSYASSYDGEDATASSAVVVTPGEQQRRAAAATSGSGSGAGGGAGSTFTTNGVLPWTLTGDAVNSTGAYAAAGVGGPSPSASTAALEPFAAAVQAAAAAVAAAATTAAGGSSTSSSSAAASPGPAAVLVAEAEGGDRPTEEEDEDEDKEEPLRSARTPMALLGRMGPMAAAAPTGSRVAESAPPPARVRPITKLPTAPARLPSSALAGAVQPTPLRRNRTLRAVDADAGGSRSGSAGPADAVNAVAGASAGAPVAASRRDSPYGVEAWYGARLKSLTTRPAVSPRGGRPEGPATTAGDTREPTVWSNALYDFAGQSYGNAGEDDVDPTLPVPTMPAL